MNARLVPRRSLAAAGVVLVAGAAWAGHHALMMADFVQGAGHRFTAVYAAMFGLLLLQLGIAYLERPATVTPRQQRSLDERHVAVIVPVYNEDRDALYACLSSLLEQSRRPDTIVVVDDGSTVDDDLVHDWCHSEAWSAGVGLEWIRQANAGKRHAQAAGVHATPQADVYWTVDSDTISDPDALDELLKPLADPDVQSVAGIVLAGNVRKSFLTRFTDLWFVTGQLTDRSALSVLRSVWVNSGPIAVYRADVVRENLDSYLVETFAGRQVRFSDDSMLTLYAMLGGHTVQQPSAFAYSLMPEKTSHHLRQFVRWMRGSFIRSWWRMRYLPVKSVAYWAHLLRWAQTVLAAAVFVAVVVIGPAIDPDPAIIPWLVTVPVLVGYATTLRYMTVRRSDQTLLNQWATWGLTPVAVIWAMVVLRAVRWYAIVTCLRTGWGTRQSVEVELQDDDRSPNPWDAPTVLLPTLAGAGTEVTASR